MQILCSGKRLSMFCVIIPWTITTFYIISAQSVPTTQPRVTTPPLVPSTCLSTEFRCSNGKCIDLRWKCDRQDDCGDLSDENGCPCRRYQFQCDNGRCQDRIWVCDGTDDCGDGSDERNCSTTPTSPSSGKTSQIIYCTCSVDTFHERNPHGFLPLHFT